MSIGAGRFYAVGSSFVHGYKWMTAYIGTEEDVLAQLADSLAAALIMTECAVALFEALATHPARSSVRRKNYPDRAPAARQARTLPEGVARDRLPQMTRAEGSEETR